MQERDSLFKYFKASGIEYAATGYYAVSLLTSFVSGVPEMFYVYPSQTDITYDAFIMRLSNQFSLLPVQKGANLIVVEPYYRKGAFFDSKFFNKEKVVSPIQLYLDICHLDQGREFIKELAEYFHKEGFYYFLFLSCFYKPFSFLSIRCFGWRLGALYLYVLPMGSGCPKCQVDNGCGYWNFGRGKI